MSNKNWFNHINEGDKLTLYSLVYAQGWQIEKQRYSRTVISLKLIVFSVLSDNNTYT